MQRMGEYPMPAGVNPTPGLEIAGEVVALGAGVTEFSVGDDVCGLTEGGGYAQYCVMPAGQTLPQPRGVDAIHAAAIPETFFTVWANLFGIAAAKAGDTLLVHGGTSVVELNHQLRDGVADAFVRGPDGTCLFQILVAIVLPQTATDEIEIGGIVASARTAFGHAGMRLWQDPMSLSASAGNRFNGAAIGLVSLTAFFSDHTLSRRCVLWDSAHASLERISWLHTGGAGLSPAERVTISITDPLEPDLGNTSGGSDLVTGMSCKPLTGRTIFVRAP
jgi:hypothetical protein